MMNPDVERYLKDTIFTATLHSGNFFFGLSVNQWQPVTTKSSAVVFGSSPLKGETGC